jgi:hypothetical protein
MTDIPATPPPDAPKEPLVSVGAIVTVVTAAIGALVAFGLKLSDDQQSALLGLVAVLAPIVVALWGRARVFAPATVRAMVKDAERP